MQQHLRVTNGYSGFRGKAEFRTENSDKPNMDNSVSGIDVDSINTNLQLPISALSELASAITKTAEGFCSGVRWVITV